MKVALLIAHSRVAPVFETTSKALFFDLIQKQCLNSNTYHFDIHSEQAIANELIAHHIELLICGAIPYYLEKSLLSQGCDVFSFIAGETSEVIQALQLNQLNKPKFKMPGCKKRTKRGRTNTCQRTVTQ